jgi:hypothetical protein
LLRAIEIEWVCLLTPVNHNAPVAQPRQQPAVLLHGCFEFRLQVLVARRRPLQLETLKAQRSALMRETVDVCLPCVRQWLARLVGSAVY